MDIESVAQDLVDAAIQVHRTLGPGLLESAYQACLAHDLTKRGRRVECELPLPLEYDGVRIDAGYRLDMRGGRISTCREQSGRNAPAGASGSIDHLPETDRSFPWLSDQLERHSSA